MKAADARTMTLDQLDDEVLKLKKEQFNLRFQRATQQLEKPARVREVRREIARVRDERVEEAELERARAYALGRYDMDRRTNERRAWYLAFYAIEDVGLDYPERYRRSLGAVTAADLQRAARAYLDPAATVVLRPPAP